MIGSGTGSANERRSREEPPLYRRVATLLLCLFEYRGARPDLFQPSGGKVAPRYAF